MQLALPVPWSYWNEWEYVYSCLYAKSTSEQQLGIKRVNAWRSRGRVPGAVECTALFVELGILDREEDPLKRRSDKELQLSYSMAVTRLATSFIDVLQRAEYTKSMMAIAREIEYPLFLMDMRHSINHAADLPALHELRLAAAVALRWVEDHYWKQQKLTLSDQTDKFIGLLTAYRKASRLQVKRKTGCIKTPEISDILLRITNAANPNAVQETLAALLVKFIIPKSDKRVEFEHVPQRLFAIWELALMQFTKLWPHFNSAMLLELVNSITKDEPVLDNPDVNYEAFRARDMSLRVAWFSHFLKLVQQDDAGVEAVVQSAIEMCMRNLNSWSHTILQKLLARFNNTFGLPLGILQTLMDFHENKVNVGKKRKTDSRGDSELLDLETLEQILQDTTSISQLTPMTNKKPKGANDTSTNTVWTRCTTWTPCPIGLLPGGEFPNLDLPLELDNYQLATFLVPKTTDNSNNGVGDQTTDTRSFLEMHTQNEHQYQNTTSTQNHNTTSTQNHNTTPTQHQHQPASKLSSAEAKPNKVGFW